MLKCAYPLRGRLRLYDQVQEAKSPLRALSKGITTLHAIFVLAGIYFEKSRVLLSKRRLVLLSLISWEHT